MEIIVFLVMYLAFAYVSGRCLDRLLEFLLGGGELPVGSNFEASSTNAVEPDESEATSTVARFEERKA